MALRSLDLMIGDWVLADNIPMQVTNLSILGGDIICVMKPFMSYDIPYAANKVALTHGARNIKHIKPIPLTKEILEKNGFVPQKPENHIEIVYCLQNIRTAIADEMYALWLEEESFDLVLRVKGKDMVRITIKYIHQLQHALRLCGIEKTIEL